VKRSREIARLLRHCSLFHQDDSRLPHALRLTSA
jgi:hypothetical protein